MPERNVFLPLPTDLYDDAVELARLRHVTLSDLLIEALSNSIEVQQRTGWVRQQLQIGYFAPSRTP